MKIPVIIILCILFILLFVSYRIYIFLKPIKYAIKMTDKNTYHNYFLCESITVTGAKWRLNYNKKQENKYGKPFQYIHLIGKSPEKSLKIELLDSSIVNNTFLLQGYFTSRDYYPFYDIIDDVEVLHITDWEILYPVRRDYIFHFLLPKQYLIKNDFKKD